MSTLRALVLLAALHESDAVTAKATSRTGLSVNPIRRVVTMLQMMQKKVTEEGEKEKELFDKFMCYCKNGAGSLGKSIEAASTKIPQIQSDLEAGGAEKAQLASDVVKAKADRKAAKAALAEAKAIREQAAKEAVAETRANALAAEAAAATSSYSQMHPETEPIFGPTSPSGPISPLAPMSRLSRCRQIISDFTPDSTNESERSPSPRIWLAEQRQRTEKLLGRLRVASEDPHAAEVSAGVSTDPFGQLEQQRRQIENHLGRLQMVSSGWTKGSAWPEDSRNR